MKRKHPVSRRLQAKSPFDPPFPACVDDFELEEGGPAPAKGSVAVGAGAPFLGDSTIGDLLPMGDLLPRLEEKNPRERLDIVCLSGKQRDPPNKRKKGS